MACVSDFKIIVNRIWNAIDAGLLQAGEDAKDVLQLVLQENVYSYPASHLAMSTRRYDAGGLMDKENMIASVIDVGKAGRTHELQIEDFAGLQHNGTTPRMAGAAERLDQIVSEGTPGYRQPGPRPFYQDTEKELVKGVVPGEIKLALMAAGFEVY